MSRGLLVFLRVCLLWLPISRVFTIDRTVYNNRLKREQGGTTYRSNVLYPSYFRTNNFWLPKIKSVKLSYIRANQRWTAGKRRQDIYDGSEYDWDSSFPAIDETPRWPPDYNTWPQAPTQGSPQVIPQQMVPTQVPIQAPYQVPAVMSAQAGVSFSPPQVLPQARPPAGTFSTFQMQTWSTRVKAARQKAKSPPVRAADMKVRKASRVCSPGPPLGVNPLFRNCLIIGDSISLGYLTTVKRELRGLCQVQHAPFAKGSGAVDSRYGLNCLSMMLRTTALEPTSYDAIVFNFGMHDIDYSKMFPEEFVPLEEYGDNLMKIKELLLQSGARVAFALTTPVPIAGRRNRRVVKYNVEAKRVMEEGRKVEIVDLHSTVIQECGEPPYETCSIMKQPKDVHFNPKGNKLLGVKVAETIRKLLAKAKPRGQLSPPKAPELSAREGLASSYMHDDTSFCPDMVTRCPARTTCCENLLSLTGYGCCMEPDAVICPDSWHCCPRGAHCSPDCNFRSCKCLFISSRPSVSKLQNEKNRKGGKESKSQSKSASESNSTNVKPGKSVKPVKPVHQIDDHEVEAKAGKENKTVKPTEVKDNPKARKKGKHGRTRKLAEKKARKKYSKGVKEKDHRHKNSNKKHKNRKTKKGRKLIKKLRSKAKYKSLKSKKPSIWKGIKAIQKINKHVVDAHTTHRKISYHPTVKQRWVTRFNNGLRMERKHKPNIKFAHTWRKRKHQDLSYKPNGNKKKKISKDTSMTEELKHLIVNHRKEKLRTTLRFHALRGHKNLASGLNDREKPRKLKHRKEQSIYSDKSRKVFKTTRHKNVLAQSVAQEVKVNEEKMNPTLSGAGNHETTNDLEVNYLRQTLREKAAAKENSSQTLNPSKSSNNVLEDFADKSSPKKNLTNDNVEHQTEKVRKNTDKGALRKGSTEESMAPSQLDIYKKKMPTNRVEISSSNGFRLNDLGIGSVGGSGSEEGISNTKSVSFVEEGVNASNKFSSSSAHSGLNKTTVRGSGNTRRFSGKGEKGIGPSEQALAKNVSIAGSSFTFKAGNNSGEATSGSGFKGFGSASALMESSSLMGEDTIEQTDDDARSERFGSSSGFDADELFVGSAGSFVLSSSLTEDSRNTISGEDVTNEKSINAKADRGLSSKGFYFKESSIESGSGNSNNSQDVTTHMDNNEPDTETGLKSDRELSFMSANSLESLSSSRDGHNVRVLSGSGLEAEESFTGSGSGHQNLDHHVMEISEEERNERSSNHFQKINTTTGLLFKDIPTNALENSGLHMPSSLTNTISESDDHTDLTTNGYRLAIFSGISGSGVYSEGESDSEKESNEDEDVDGSFRSSNIGDFHSEMLLSRGEIRVNFEKKVEFPQNVLSHYSRNSSEGSSNDISQMSYSGWDEMEDNNSGIESGLYQPNAQWGSGEYGFSEGLGSKSLASHSKPTSSRGPTMISPNESSTVYPNTTLAMKGTKTSTT